MSQNIADVAVIGAGIIGTTIAERLQHEKKQVLLIDRELPGEGCSKGNAGHFATDIILPLANFNTLLTVPKLLLDPLGPLSIQWSYLPKLLPWLFRFSWAAMPHKTQHSIAALKTLNRPSIKRFQRLLERNGLTSLMTCHGALTICQSEKGMRKNRKHAELLGQHNINVEQLDTQQVLQLEPNLSGHISGGLFFPDTAHSINPHYLVTALAENFTQAGGKFVKKEVLSLEYKNDQNVHLNTSSGQLVAREVIIACGAWSKQLAANAGHKVPLETERGYHLMLPEAQVEITRPVTSFERSFVMTPMEQGLRLAGTVELAGLTNAPNYQRAEALYQYAKELLPEINYSKASRWMGHRPSLPDSLPIIGRSSKNRQILFAFGHQHLGLTQAAVTADIISDIIHGNQSKVNIDPFRIERF